MPKWLMALLMASSCFSNLGPGAMALANDRAVQVQDQNRDQGKDQGKGNDEDKRRKEEEEKRRREEDKRRKEEDEKRKREEERKKEEEKKKNNPAPAKGPSQGNPNNPSNLGNPGNNPGGPGRPAGPGKPEEQRSYYGQVTINASGQVRSGDTIVQSASPWLQLAAPGMWLEASGNWEGDTFLASEVKLHSPQSWAFYQGPATLVGANQYQNVSAWLSTNRQAPFIALKAAPDSQSEVRLVAYFDGKKLRATPNTFPAPPTGLEVGWVELIGKIGPQGLVWSSAKAFP